ncbi:MAG: ABC transporter permease subunit [Planctomycetota bacterium]
MSALVRNLASLPKRLVLNPILARELRVAGRRKSTYINRAGFALLLAFGVVFVLLTMTNSYGWAGDSVIYRAQELTRTVQFLTYSLLWIGFALLTLLGPVLTAGSICDERRARTLDTLATTPVSPLQIVVGKLAARLQEALVLGLIAAPPLLALRVFGGVPGETILAFVAVAFCTTYLGAALGVWFSTWHRGAAGAIVYAFLTMGLLTVAPAIIGAVALQNNFFNAVNLGIPREVLAGIATAMIGTCPPVVLAFEMAGSPLGVPVPARLQWIADHAWAANAAWLVIQATIITLIASRAVATQLAGAGDSGDAAVQAPTEKQSSRRLRKLNAAPVYWREATARLFPRRWHAVVVVIVLTLFLGWAYIDVGMAEGPLHQLLGFTGLALVTLLAAVSTTGAISSEREARTWDVLITAPISGRHILASKILASLRRLILPVALLMLHFIAAAIMGHFAPADVLLIPAVLIPTALFYLASGLLFSLAFKKIITAIACNIILLITLWVGVAVLTLIFMEVVLDGYGPSEDIIGTTLFIYHPVTMIAAIIEHGIDAGFGTDTYQLADAQVQLPVFTLALGAQVTFHLVGAAIFFALSVKLFKSRGGRSS